MPLPSSCRANPLPSASFQSCRPVHPCMQNVIPIAAPFLPVLVASLSLSGAWCSQFKFTASRSSPQTFLELWVLEALKAAAQTHSWEAHSCPMRAQRKTGCPAVPPLPESHVGGETEVTWWTTWCVFVSLCFCLFYWEGNFQVRWLLQSCLHQALLSRQQQPEDLQQRTDLAFISEFFLCCWQSCIYIYM